MSPDDIAEVTTRWTSVLAEPVLLHAAIMERLTGSLRFRAARAQWLVDAVTCLSGVLDHPGEFMPMAADILVRRGAVTIDELASERDSLLQALEELSGPLAQPAVRAWERAIGLFVEIVSSVGLDPFRRPQ